MFEFWPHYPCVVETANVAYGSKTCAVRCIACRVVWMLMVFTGLQKQPQQERHVRVPGLCAYNRGGTGMFEVPYSSY